MSSHKLMMPVLPKEVQNYDLTRIPFERTVVIATTARGITTTSSSRSSSSCPIGLASLFEEWSNWIHES